MSSHYLDFSSCWVFANLVTNISYKKTTLRTYVCSDFGIYALRHQGFEYLKLVFLEIQNM